MALETETRDGGTVITLPARALDAAHSDEFRRDISPHLVERSKIVLDLHKLPMIDSSGLGVLLSCLRQVNAAGGDVRIGAAPAHIKIVFEMVRMHKVFRLFDTTAAA